MCNVAIYAPVLASYPRRSGKKHDARGVVGIVELAQVVKLPQLVAGLVSKIELPLNQLAELLRTAIDFGERLDSLAASVVADGYTRIGSEWADKIRVLVSELGLAPARVARLF